MRILFLFFLFLTAACQLVKSPSHTEKPSNPLLFSVGDSAVYADEFIYVYTKNNARLDSAFTHDDVSDYLELYINFKLKVREAYQQRLDTLSTYKSELASYIEQLKKPYLTSTRISEELVVEAYDRLAVEVRASHILIRVDDNASPQDTLKAYQKITGLRESALAGANFDSLANSQSEDPSARSNDGDLGYFTSMQMVYPFESAAYNTGIGEISPVIRTRFGYHIIKVTDRQKASGRVVVSHIMLRHTADSTSVENQIREIYHQLERGESWNDLVAAFSEDLRSKPQNGRLQPFGRGQLPEEFQNAAFSLAITGEICEPVKTPYGWHIIRLEEHLPVPSLEEMRPTIEKRIQSDGRAEVGKEEMVKRLLKEWRYEENARGKSTLSDSMATWKNDTVNVLFTLDDTPFTRGDFFEYLQQESGTAAYAENSEALYNEFTASAVLTFEEEHLEDKFPDYRMLLREYREGLLYFQLMEKEIWVPASEDTAGIRAYYESNLQKYGAPRTAAARVYTLVDSTIAPLLTEAIKEGNALRIEQLSQKYQADYGLSLVPVNISWEEHSASQWNVVPMKNGVYTHVINDKLYIVEVFETQQGSIAPLDQIRGLVISDYQKSLEENWLDNLKGKYTVIRDNAGENYVFENLVR